MYLRIAYCWCIQLPDNREGLLFRRTSEQRAKKIAAYATDASGIDRQKRNGGRARGGILLRLFPQVGTRCIASGQFGRKTHPNHVQSREFAMPRALNMRFITHEELSMCGAVKRRVLSEPLSDVQKLVT